VTECLRVTPNPLAQDPVTDPEDRALVLRAKSGDAAALEELVVRHQAWIYNIAVRMLYHTQDAEDATQEILVKALTALSLYEGRSRFRTWLYRIVVNHVLTTKRGRLEPPMMSFSCYAHGLDRTADLDPPDQSSVPIDVRLQAGVPRSVAMKLTGHKTENVYRRYAIVSDADLDAAAQKLSAASAGR
jgi:RNA polymerase sigma factor (sigma-70 family)